MLILIELPERIFYKLFHTRDIEFINDMYDTDFNIEEPLYIYIRKMPWGFEVYDENKKLILDEYLIEMDDAVIDLFEKELNNW